METMSTLAVSPAYTALLVEFPPRVIRTAEQMRVKSPRCMRWNSVTTSGALKGFGTPSIVSEGMNGKREMNKEHIKRLSERFGVSPELFF